jgi:DNA (cytosine-5)-methyltransferase 1
MDVVAVPVAQVQWSSGGGKVHNPTAQALRSGAEHNYQFAQVGMQVRRLTPTECERLQGFPDGWTAGFSDSTRYKMLGNAVCVNVSEWIARRLMAVYGEGK